MGPLIWDISKAKTKNAPLPNAIIIAKIAMEFFSVSLKIAIKLKIKDKMMDNETRKKPKSGWILISPYIKAKKNGIENMLNSNDQ